MFVPLSILIGNNQLESQGAMWEALEGGDMEGPGGRKGKGEVM